MPHVAHAQGASSINTVKQSNSLEVAANTDRLHHAVQHCAASLWCLGSAWQLMRFLTPKEFDAKP